MIGRFLRRQRPPVRVTHYTPRQYLESRALGGNVVRVEHPQSSPGIPPRLPGDAGAVPLCGTGGAVGSDPDRPVPSAFDCLAGHYDFGGNPNVND
jgi:hypothetical protein